MSAETGQHLIVKALVLSMYTVNHTKVQLVKTDNTNTSNSTTNVTSQQYNQYIVYTHPKFDYIICGLTGPNSNLLQGAPSFKVQASRESVNINLPVVKLYILRLSKFHILMLHFVVTVSIANCFYSLSIFANSRKRLCCVIMSQS